VQQDVEWQALDVLVREASSRRGEKTELEVQEVKSKDPPSSVFILRNEQSLTEEEEKLVPKVVFLTMSDSKQQQSQPQPQPPPPQPQQQTAAVIDQNVQQVQVQVSVMETFPCSVRKQGDDLFSH
jgi:hypothetical protein